MFLKRRSTRVFFGLFGLFVLAVAAIPLQTAQADTAPKPTMKFKFAYEMSPAPSIVSGIQEECGQADCSDAKPLMEGGPQRFTCTAVDCSSLAYSYSEYHRLKITFSDGLTRQSNIFIGRFSSNYLVTVNETGLRVEPKWIPPWGPSTGAEDDALYGMETYYSLFNAVILFCASVPTILLPGIFLILIAVRATGFRKSWAAYVAAWLSFILALLLYATMPFIREGMLATLAIELPLAIGYLLWRKRSAVYLLTIVLMMNIITHALLSYFMGAFFDLTAIHLLWILVCEFVIWIIEAAILAFALRKEARFLEALLLSLVLNGASFGIGWLLPF